MKTTDNNRAAVRVCAIADIECSRNCGTGACEREARYSVEQHEAAPAGVDALTDQQLIDMWSAGNRAILNGAGSRSAATAMRVAVGTSAAPLEGTGNGADERAAFQKFYYSPACKTIDECAPIRGANYCGEPEEEFAWQFWQAARAPRTEVAGTVSGECFIVIGHGESDIPEAKIVTRRDDLLDAVLGMMYGSASDAPADLRADYAAMLSDENEWAADTWSVSFEIGGIVVWHVGLHPFAPQPPSADAAAAPADERAAFNTRACAESLNSMITDWVESCLRMELDWRGITDVIERRLARFTARAAASQPAAAAGQEAVAFQSRVQPWMLACFGAEIAADRIERNHRFLEEALELVQACGCTASEAHQLVDYTFGRPVGEPAQEAGGVMVTLAALCLANSLDMHAAGETELARVWTKVEQIRAKQAAKPKNSPLPEAAAPEQVATRQELTREQHGVLMRLACVLETGHASNGIADDNAEIYAMALRALLEGAKQ
ncbi:hypothetical protein QZM35_17260 [Burkholderia sp. AU45274]|uniref:hypothetical protein n=1 Tax=Burkholderia sp. AU45274 TaxID=3059205 RepID=UPI002652C832|nr:hypothetical protein [Burkholderia sp. AU45274]MDN7489459.1 hypothetical protein [Burkholderia sp. AU45274]